MDEAVAISMAALRRAQLATSQNTLLGLAEDAIKAAIADFGKAGGPG